MESDTSEPNADLPVPDHTTPSISPARREFLTASVAATAALLPGCLTEGSDEPTPTLASAAALSKFDHIVVAMFENRSFDSLIGYACQPGEPPRNQTYNGVAGKVFRNPVPDYIKDGHAFVETRVSPGTDADMQNPNPDPGREYEHVNRALYSVVNPITNQFSRKRSSVSQSRASARSPAQRRCRRRSAKRKRCCERSWGTRLNTRDEGFYTSARSRRLRYHKTRL